ncbi:MAG: hypothetical protein QXN23_06035 [Candidatus Caldarchaeum sp.]
MKYVLAFSLAILSIAMILAAVLLLFAAKVSDVIASIYPQTFVGVGDLGRGVQSI